jgi:predicted nucleotidyltransferase
MPAQLYLRKKDQDQLLALLRVHLPGVSAWAYGSRVNGTAHETSDLDVALRASNLEPINPSALSDFQEALSQSNIPILVDVHDWSRLPKTFHAEITKKHIALV